MQNFLFGPGLSFVSSMPLGFRNFEIQVASRTQRLRGLRRQPKWQPRSMYVCSMSSSLDVMDLKGSYWMGAFPVEKPLHAYPCRP